MELYFVADLRAEWCKVRFFVKYRRRYCKNGARIYPDGDSEDPGKDKHVSIRRIGYFVSLGA